MIRLAGVFAAVMALAIATHAQADQAPVKVGVLTDMSSLYADIGGEGSVEAAGMAIKDFGGSVLGKPIELVFADQLRVIPADQAFRPLDQGGCPLVKASTAQATH